MKRPLHALLALLLLIIASIAPASAQIIPGWTTRGTDKAGYNARQFPIRTFIRGNTVAIPYYYEYGLTIDGTQVATGDQWATGAVAVFDGTTRRFVRTFGREINSYDYATSTAIDSQGNIYVGGNAGKGRTVTVTPGHTMTIEGYHTGSVVKFDPNGAFVWARVMDGPDWNASTQNEYVQYLDIRPDDKLVVQGYFVSNYVNLAGTRVNATFGGDIYNTYTAVLNPDGSLFSATVVSSPGKDYTAGVTALADNGYVVSGTVAGPSMYAGIPMPGTPGWNNAYAARHRADGSVAWVRMLELSPYSSLGQAIPLPNGDLAFRVYFQGQVSLDDDPEPEMESAPYDYAEAIVIYSADGVYKSHQRIPFGMNFRIAALNPAIGHIVATGYGSGLDINYDGFEDYTATQGLDLFVMDAATGQIWTLDQPYDQVIHDLDITPDGRMLASTYTRTTNVAYLDGAVFYFTLGDPLLIVPGGPPVTDADGDGVPDDMDNCPALSNPDQQDFDDDGIGDVCDEDRDGDGVDNDVDLFPDNPAEWADNDGDGLGDNADPDDDNDGYTDVDEAANSTDPFDDTVTPPDFDGDHVSDLSDPDDDNDGVPDNDDAFPFDALEWADSDGDGTGDNADLFPDDPLEAFDFDGDGVGDNGDRCAATVLPDPVATQGLGQNRWMVDADGIWITNAKKIKKQYTLADTGGCGCADIMDAMELGNGHLKFGCASGVLDDWMALIGSAGKGFTGEPFTDAGLPSSVELDDAYPNPFNPATSIRFGLPEAQRVRVAIYDVVGRQIDVLADGVLSAGYHTLRFEASGLPSGLYLLRMDTPGQTLTRKLTLLK